MAGPWAGMQLGGLGADVIRIEDPALDWGSLRGAATPRINGVGCGYIAWNMNKRGLFLDLKSPHDLSTARQLLATCDVFLTNLRPGVSERLGLGYEAIAEINPQLI